MEHRGRESWLAWLFFVERTAQLLLTRLDVPLGRLHGDVRTERDGGAFHLRIATLSADSIILTSAANLLLRIIGG